MPVEPHQDLVAMFTLHLQELSQEIIQTTGFHPNFFMHMVAERGGFATALALLSKPKMSDGLMRLQKENALHLSLEAAVLQEPWSTLFEEEQKKTARKWLRQLGYEP